MYTSKALRRGATQELIRTGRNLAAIKVSGAWVGGGFKSYIDLEFDKTLRVSQMIIKYDQNTSPEGDPPRKGAPRKGELRSKRAQTGYRQSKILSDSPNSETSEEK